MLRSVVVHRQTMWLIVRRNLLIQASAASSVIIQPLKSFVELYSQRMALSSLSYQDPIFKEKHKVIPVGLDENYTHHHPVHHQDIISSSSSSLLHHESMATVVANDVRNISSIQKLEEHHHHPTSADEDTDFPLFKTKTQSAQEQRQKSDEEIYGVIMDY